MSDRTTNELLWTTIGYGVTAGASLVILAGLWLLVPGVRRGLLPLPRLRPGTWTGRDVVLAFFAMHGFPLVTIQILFRMGFFTPLIGPAPDTDPPGEAAHLYAIRCVVICSPLSVTLTLGILFAMLFARSGCRPHHLGMTWARWPTNLALGLVALIVIVPFVYTLHALVSIAMGAEDHALTRAAASIENDWEWCFIGFHALVAAPFLEEIVFRGVLLGWLRRASLAGHLGVVSATYVVSLFGAWVVAPGEEQPTFQPGPFLFAILLTSGYLYWMVRLSRRFRLDEDEIQAWLPLKTRDPLDVAMELSNEEIRQRSEQRLNAWRDANARLAVYGSAMLFALFHVDAWPAPIALFPLALALGELARRTQSLIGPITLHAAFNLIAFIGLYGVTLQGDAKNGKAATMPTPTPIVGSICTSVPGSQLPLRK